MAGIIAGAIWIACAALTFATLTVQVIASSASTSVYIQPSLYPRIDYKPEPEPKPEVVIEPKPEVVIEPKPEVAPEPENDGNLWRALPEPFPHWELAVRQWGAAWKVHIYVLPIAFVALAVWALSLLVRRKRCVFQKRYFSVLQLFMLVTTAMRAVYLLVDPYGSRGFATHALLILLHGFPLPLFTVGFTILFLALIDLSRVSLQTLGSRILTWKTAIATSFVQIVFNTTTDILLALQLAGYVLSILCKGVMALWGISVSVGFWYAGKKIISTVRESFHTTVRVRRRSTIAQESNNLGQLPGMSSEPEKDPEDDAKGVVLRVVKIAYGSSVVCFLLAGIQIYDLLASMGWTNEVTDGYADPWAWWARQSCMSVVELVMASLLLYATTDPKRSTLMCLMIGRIKNWSVVKRNRNQSTARETEFPLPSVTYFNCNSPTLATTAVSLRELDSTPFHQQI